ncbi:hypothetical protein ACJRO7_026472 [Eucalyptus globulus]|uniref:Uncharacterized protein n=1 Tax=Eucalyptus globulus TaxID=34317 RepID=A0ABD3JQT9_EUCGL
MATSSHITKTEGNCTLYFKMNRRVRLSKMFSIYYKMQQLDVKTVWFFYEGNRIIGNQTPQQDFFGTFLYFIVTCCWDWRTMQKSALLSTDWEVEDSSTDKSHGERTFLLCFYETSNEIETIYEVWRDL